MTVKTYDIVLFGVTGFTGKLAVEYLLNKNDSSLKWAACARSEPRAQAVLKEIADSVNQPPPALVIADLVCQKPDDEAKLRKIVASTKVVLTAAGPFEKYGITLHKLCAEEGVHYADITGETSFFRHIIEAHDDTARKNKASLVSHCGNDCIPQDMTVFEMHEYARSKGCTLKKVTTLDVFPSEATFSGGTLTTAMYQLGKSKSDQKPTSMDYDPLLKTLDGKKSEHSTKVIHKGSQYHEQFGRKAGPWIMGPVMANCVRRSNAVLGYNTALEYGDAAVDDPSWTNWVKRTAFTGVVGVSMYVTPLQKFLPQPGEGPDRQTMEDGFLKLYGYGVMEDENGKEIPIYSLFHFHHDTGYYMTAQLLVETGILLVKKDAAKTLTEGGVLTPAIAFGSELTKHLTKELECTFDLQEIPFDTTGV